MIALPTSASFSAFFTPNYLHIVYGHCILEFAVLISTITFWQCIWFQLDQCCTSTQKKFKKCYFLFFVTTNISCVSVWFIDRTAYNPWQFNWWEKNMKNACTRIRILMNERCGKEDINFAIYKQQWLRSPLRYTCNSFGPS